MAIFQHFILGAFSAYPSFRRNPKLWNLQLASPEYEMGNLVAYSKGSVRLSTIHGWYLAPWKPHKFGEVSGRTMRFPQKVFFERFSKTVESPLLPSFSGDISNGRGISGRLLMRQPSLTCWVFWSKLICYWDQNTKIYQCQTNLGSYLQVKSVDPTAFIYSLHRHIVRKESSRNINRQNIM